MTVTVQTAPPVVATRPGRLIGVGAIRSALSPAAENATCSISLDNGDGYFSALFAAPPLGIEVDIEDGGETIFTGAITDCKLSAVCDLGCES
jgi:hypothetical protein